MIEPATPEPTPRQKFETLAKRLIAVPKETVAAAQAEWKKTKHKRKPASSGLI
jgi:hypothetical protein